MLTAQEAEMIRAQYKKHEHWLREVWRKNSYRAEDVPAGCEYPGTEKVSALEVYEFCSDIPDRYFLYIRHETGEAITFGGDLLGSVLFGREWQSNMGDRRVPITIKAINGYTYYGTYYKDAGDYARVKRAKQ